MNEKQKAALKALAEEVANREGHSIIDPDDEGYDSWGLNYEIEIHLTIREVRDLLDLP